MHKVQNKEKEHRERNITMEPKKEQKKGKQTWNLQKGHEKGTYTRA